MAWICVAGHPAPVILRADGSLQWIEGSGALLGVLDDAELSDEEFRLSAGDTLILYTDGVTEERGEGGPFGEQGLVKPCRARRDNGHRRSSIGSSERCWRTGRGNQGTTSRSSPSARPG